LRSIAKTEGKDNEMMIAQLISVETRQHNSNQAWNGNRSKKQVRRIEVKAITFLR